MHGSWQPAPRLRGSPLNQKQVPVTLTASSTLTPTANSLAAGTCSTRSRSWEHGQSSAPDPEELRSWETSYKENEVEKSIRGSCLVPVGWPGICTEETHHPGEILPSGSSGLTGPGSQGMMSTDKRRQHAGHHPTGWPP